MANCRDGKFYFKYEWQTAGTASFTLNMNAIVSREEMYCKPFLAADGLLRWLSQIKLTLCGILISYHIIVLCYIVTKYRPRAHALPERPIKVGPAIVGVLLLLTYLQLRTFCCCLCFFCFWQPFCCIRPFSCCSTN
jgi:hypothetical protein